MKLVDLAIQNGDRSSAASSSLSRRCWSRPHFLFRVELDSRGARARQAPATPRSVESIGEFELASRLSYFLWSSMPDDELFALAGDGSAPVAEIARQAGPADAPRPEGAGAGRELRRPVAAAPQPAGRQSRPRAFPELRRASCARR